MATSKASAQALDEAVQAAQNETVNRYEHGFRQLHLAKLTADGTSSTAPTYDTPVAISGEVKLSLSDGSSATEVYAGDGLYESIDGPAAFTGTLDVYGDLPAELEQWVMGHSVDANGSIGLKEGTARKPFALLAQVQGSDEPVDLVLYKVKVTKENDIAPETDTDKPVVNAHSYAIIGYYQNFSGARWYYSRVKASTSPKSFEAFFTKVYDPTTKAEA